MLQQTQTERVVPKYLAWMERFPGPAELAAAPLPEVLALWSGLGYNRRALALVRAAGLVAESGFPRDEEGLLSLPGVGPYTAAAVAAFAFGEPAVLVETNVRSVFIHHFFAGSSASAAGAAPGADALGAAAVSDAAILPLVRASLYAEDPRTWYYALMDRGVEIKRVFGNPNRRSASYVRQSPFKDSRRRLRGELLKALAASPSGGAAGLGLDELARGLPFSRERVEEALAALVAEGFVAERRGRYAIADRA